MSRSEIKALQLKLEATRRELLMVTAKRTNHVGTKVKMGKIVNMCIRGNSIISGSVKNSLISSSNTL